MDTNQVINLAVQCLPPVYERLMLTFYGDQSRPCADQVVIGDDYGTELRVRLSDGAVLSIDPEGNLPRRFLNSSIEQLAKFIEMHRSYSGRASTDIDAAALARELRRQLQAIDPAAFDDAENWWAVVMEQVDDGML